MSGNFKHGCHGTRPYNIWKGIRYRCNNPNNKNYSYYGGRGIKVCKEWDSFPVFLQDMGMPEEGMSIERIDNNKGYSKENCCWLPRKLQSKNQRSNWKIQIGGRVFNSAEASEILGYHKKNLEQLLRYHQKDKSKIHKIETLWLRGPRKEWKPKLLNHLGLPL